MSFPLTTLAQFSMMRPPRISRHRMPAPLRMEPGAGLALLCVLSALLPLSAAPTFNQDIRPLLSDRCFACHGFDGNAREADLRLDVAEAAYAQRESGTPIVPGDPEASLIWQRIISEDPDEVMPPSDSHLKLSAEEKSLIKEWIEAGAKYEKHWAFMKVDRPVVKDAGAHPVDVLVAERLRKEDLALSPEADKVTLIRRLSLDLRGLPPSPEEVADFLADHEPGAWERLVDRFLASHSLGERFAWPWLDAARYADTNGYQGDNERTMWPWRDWVVKAINENLPYDQFTVWQLAGDLLPDPTFEQTLATGFLRNHPINGEGGRIPEENRVDYAMDMVETAGTVWMALTLNCCRCHDHKYDALSQKEYFSLYDFFNQSPLDGSGGNPQTPPVLATPDEDQKSREGSLLARVAGVNAERDRMASVLEADQARWEEELLAGSRQSWQPLQVRKATSLENGIKFKTLPDGSQLVSGRNHDKATYTVLTEASSREIHAIRLDALRHPSMTKGGLARSDSGNFVLTGFEVWLRQDGQPRKRVALAKARATFEQSSFEVTGALDNNPNTGWAVYDGKPITRDHSALFFLAEPLSISGPAVLEFVLRHTSPHRHHNLGRFLLSTTDRPEATFGSNPVSVLAVLRVEPEKRNGEQKTFVREAYLGSDPKYASLTRELEDLEQQLKTLRGEIPKVMVMADRKQRRETFVLETGLYNQPTEVKVEAATPAALPPLATEGRVPNRLDFANWLVSRDHPLTSRVVVNRLWQELFGIGLVKTTEDFGVQGEVPVHGALLDWLSAEFMESGWDHKHLLKTIVTSRTYRQSSRCAPALHERDPQNRLLARGARYRLPFWMIRDQALAASGLLVDKPGGPPVKPYQPAGLWAEVTFGGGKKVYVQDTGEALYRRSLYTFWRRISAPPMFFDNSTRLQCEVKSARTNTPLHALFTLNEPIFIEAARHLATGAHVRFERTPDRLRDAFLRTLGRNPDEEELALLQSAHAEALAAYRADPGQAAKLLAIGDSPLAPTPYPAELAATTAVCLTILNLDEALTRE